ncbi:MAG: precorrin-6y C5,15-methyltransferase (decarboxylating) subunit CbiE [Shimia sp.]|uniref:precorrin-6y C5,15-methyltransferase (decarboxylating) subunit CbiE n=1 Tax=Shimia sp. TaxID=1954381 RepID=UPI003B8E55F6
MSENPWLTIVGLGEDGPEGLSPASRKALEEAEVILGAERHLSLLPDLSAELITWPVPFVDGIPLVLEHRGRNTVALASGDPFWYGAGTSLTKHLNRGEWLTLPAPSTMSLAAAALGWPLDSTTTLGLHAAPFARLRPHLAEGTRTIVTLRSGATVPTFATWLTEIGFGTSTLHVLEALGGPRQRIRETRANAFDLENIQHPVCVAIDAVGGPALTSVGGKDDAFFDNDGQITKRPVRALTLSALAPLPGEHLWDIGGGSGSIAIEWLLAHPTTQATSVEIDPTRAERITQNAASLGADRLSVVTGAAPSALEGLPAPDAVFIGGGISEEVLRSAWAALPDGARLVANAVTLETEVLLANWQADKGGDLLRIELAQSKPLGRKRGWKSSYPIVQWSVQK